MSRFKITLITLVLVCITCQNLATVQVNNEIPLLLQNYVTPEHYDIELKVNTIKENVFYGSIFIFIKINQPTTHIYLHAQQPHVQTSSIVLYRKIGLNYQKFFDTRKITYYQKSHTLDIAFSSSNYLTIGHYMLKISFKTTLYEDEGGLFKTISTNEAK